MYFQKRRSEEGAVALPPRWRLSSVDEGIVERLRTELECSPLMARLLYRRGIEDAQDAATFLAPTLKSLHAPESLPNLHAALDRIDLARQRGESIAVFGDYDVDGVTSTALLFEFFRFVGHPVRYRLPRRLTEGYGVRADAMREFAAQGVSVVITVDNGVSAVEALTVARSLGIDVVVLDHHQPPEELPPATAIVNPWLPGSDYPFKDLAGVGVAFKFVWALCQRFSRQKKVSSEFRDFLVDLLPFVALGTIADVVPLVGENRTFVTFGLMQLLESRRPGFQYLVETARRDREALSAEDVAFRIAPMLNAAGRLKMAESALELLLATDRDQAESIGSALRRANEDRKRIESEICDEARGLITSRVDLDREKAIVLGAEGWHAGVIGIVAARLMEEFHRPTLIVSLDGAKGRGSARSIPGVNIAAALERCGDCLLSHGGHELAAGIEIESNRLSDLRERLTHAIDLDPSEMVPTTEVDAHVCLDEIAQNQMTQIARLEPFGEKNPAPLLVTTNAEVVGEPRALGANGQHLAFHVRQEGAVRRAIAFGAGERFGHRVRRGQRLALLYAPQVSTWRGERNVELRVRDLEIH